MILCIEIYTFFNILNLFYNFKSFHTALFYCIHLSVLMPVCIFISWKKKKKHRGAKFFCKVVAEVCKISQIQEVNTSSYHPQTIVL